MNGIIQSKGVIPSTSKEINDVIANYILAGNKYYENWDINYDSNNIHPIYMYNNTEEYLHISGIMYTNLYFNDIYYDNYIKIDVKFNKNSYKELTHETLLDETQMITDAVVHRDYSASNSYSGESYWFRFNPSFTWRALSGGREFYFNIKVQHLYAFVIE